MGAPGVGRVAAAGVVERRVVSHVQPQIGDVTTAERLERAAHHQRVAFGIGEHLLAKAPAVLCVFGGHAPAQRARIGARSDVFRCALGVDKGARRVAHHQLQRDRLYGVEHGVEHLGDGAAITTEVDARALTRRRAQE